MALNFTPTYQDYLGYYGKGGDGALSEQQWNSLGTAGQWHALDDGFHIGPDDPRYADLARQLHMTNGRMILFGQGNAPLNAQRVNGRTSFVDPNNVLQGDGAWATAHDNLTPQAQFSGGGLSDKGWAIAAASLLAGGALAGGALGGAAGAGTGAGIEGGFGTGADIAGTAGAGSAGSAGATGGLLGNAGMPGYAGAYDAEGASGLAGSAYDPLAAGGASGLSPYQIGGLGPDELPAGSANATFDASGNLVPASSSGGSANGLLGQAGQWAANNPLRALGLAQTAYGLLGGHGSTSGSHSNGSSGSKGGNGSSANFTIPQQQFYVNPYIAAQIKRGYGQ